MTSSEDDRAALTREREARATTYLAAVAERDASPNDRRAQARFGSALRALEFWSDPSPGSATGAVESGELGARLSQRSHREEEEEHAVEAVVARILNA
jgi:hypothetical protein